MQDANNLPDGLERELLIVLMEECAEVQQQVSKILRFGVNATGPDQEKTNAELLAAEVGDLSHMIQRCIEIGLFSAEDIEKAAEAKRAKLNRYLRHK
ncbi:hypothetical protein [Pseudovibrio sp. Ad26]|uniref:hypothetical protein n=1 Tax=Pseudovibrio sp. Ad26 TaxID=989410 RepID=UPI0007AEA9C3|nr:hypothetical protein [Pseudovibrio sp. Ad26]KZL14570.1 hypothetical protein PsAD26_01207 [Pseudovibrio sp. Ad26]